jgi:hypothetical protein
VSSTRVVNNPLKLVYSDVWGPDQTSVSGIIIILVSSMLIVASRGSIYLRVKLMCLMFSCNFNCMSSVFSRIILFMFSRIGGEYRNLNTFFNKLGSQIVSHVHIYISRTVLLSANTVISLKLASHYLLMSLCLFIFGVMLFPLPTS